MKNGVHSHPTSQSNLEFITTEAALNNIWSSQSPKGDISQLEDISWYRDNDPQSHQARIV